MTEELKLIIDALGQAGNGVMWCFITYMVIKFVLFPTVLVGGLGLLLYRIAKLLMGISESYQTLKNWRDRLQIGSMGELTPREFDEVRVRINRLVELDLKG